MKTRVFAKLGAYALIKLSDRESGCGQVCQLLAQRAVDLGLAQVSLRANERQETPSEGALLRSPATSYWLRSAILSTEERDIVDALADAEVLVELLQRRHEKHLERLKKLLEDQP